MKIIFTIIALLVLTGCALPMAREEEPVTVVVEQETPVEASPPEEEEDGPLKMLAVNAYQFAFEPDVLEVDHGDRVMITVTSLDVGHGFALPDFGVNERVPPEESIEVRFVADKRGEFEFFNSVYSGKGWKEMRGRLIVK